MIHFFLSFSKEASSSPFARALQDLEVEHQVFSGEVLLRYKRRIWLLLIGLPKLGIFAVRSAWRSLVRSTPRPELVVVGSHLEALVFGVARKLLRRDTRIFLVGFIFTPRENPLADKLRRLYFETLFAQIDGVICYSALEKNRYDELFTLARGKFGSIPYGLYIHGFESMRVTANTASSYALSAGRSGRDYRTLFDVFTQTGYPLHVVCDSRRALSGCKLAQNIEVRRECYGPDFQKELGGAGMVIIPLAVDDISAGQMVLIQAMAYKKPIIATRTATIEEYLDHEVNALLVEPHSENALSLAVERLRTDPALAARLAENAYQTYLAKFSMNAFVTNIVRAVNPQIV